MHAYSLSLFFRSSNLIHVTGRIEYMRTEVADCFYLFIKYYKFHTSSTIINCIMKSKYNSHNNIRVLKKIKMYQRAYIYIPITNILFIKILLNNYVKEEYFHIPSSLACDPFLNLGIESIYKIGKRGSLNMQLINLTTQFTTAHERAWFLISLKLDPTLYIDRG